MALYRADREATDGRIGRLEKKVDDAIGGGGVPGPVGPEGPAGPAGADGADGLDSAVPGPTGPAGAKGAKGDKGNTGDTGAAGTNGTDGADSAVVTQGAAISDSTAGDTAQAVVDINIILAALRSTGLIAT